MTASHGVHLQTKELREKWKSVMSPPDVGKVQRDESHAPYARHLAACNLLAIGGAAQPFGVVGGFCKVRCQHCIEG